MDFIDLDAQQRAISENLNARIQKVLAHGQYIMGPEVRELELTLARYVGVQHCLSVSSGTDALLIALMSLGVGLGDEVITTPFTYAATAEVVALLGARPVFVDIEVESANIDPGQIAEAITEKTKAIMPVSLFGQVANLAEINEIAMQYGHIPVIEDAAQSFGAADISGRSCGISTVGCTSFFPSKPLGCYGDGGALFTDSTELAEKAGQIRIHGQSSRYVHDCVGVGGRMDTLQCAILLAKWPRFEWEVEQRQAIGARYTKKILEAIPGADFVSSIDLLEPLEAVRLLRSGPSKRGVFGQYTVLVPRRASICEYLEKFSIPTAIHYPRVIYDQKAYSAYRPEKPAVVAEWMARHVVSLPMGPDLKASDQDLVIDTLAAALS
ncbi:DegT/DnrJ/EryC1/StrS family aminotransferase [Luminiphilus sp.]|nr:DegT/DnrJ/EryC1/StrS family aminotransferase [Luminiphilus sp.]